MPKLRNPKKGYVTMANNKFAEDSFDTEAVSMKCQQEDLIDCKK